MKPILEDISHHARFPDAILARHKLVLEHFRVHGIVIDNLDRFRFAQAPKRFNLFRLGIPFERAHESLVTFVRIRPVSISFHS